jgi:hypothetical protein
LNAEASTVPPRGTPRGVTLPRPPPGNDDLYHEVDGPRKPPASSDGGLRQLQPVVGQPSERVQ